MGDATQETRDVQDQLNMAGDRIREALAFADIWASDGPEWSPGAVVGAGNHLVWTIDQALRALYLARQAYVTEHVRREAASDARIAALLDKAADRP